MQRFCLSYNACRLEEGDVTRQDGRVKAAVCTVILGLAANALAWETLESCRFVPHEANDGDSFRVEHQGKEYAFRLYFVDAPEVSDRLPDRVADQAQHFGTTTERLTRAGRVAKNATEDLLAGRFDVTTRWQSGGILGGLPRYYAFVFIESEKPGVAADLIAVLVANGLARVHGVPAIPPDSELSATDLRKMYEELQAQAKSEGAGAWGSGDKIQMAAYMRDKASASESKPTSARPKRTAFLDYVTETLQIEPSKLSDAPQPQPESVVSRSDRLVSLGQRSEVIYQKAKENYDRICLTAPVDTLAKVTDYRTGKVEGLVWVVGDHPTPAYLNVSAGLYKVVFAQGVMENADGEFYANRFGKLAEPIEVNYGYRLNRPVLNLCLVEGDPPILPASAKEFGSFRPPYR